MRKLLITSLLVSAVGILHAQRADSSVTDKPVNHEFGFNTTMLLKQVFNISNTTLPMLPYDLTYKRIKGRSAWRFGLGLDADMQKINSSNSLQGSTTPRPEDNVETYNQAVSTDFRAGYEWRFAGDRRVLIYGGFDVVGTFSRSASQAQAANINTFNGDYFYNRTTQAANGISAGAGPVGGLQLGLTRRLSLFTELPVYFVFSQVKDETISYTHNIQNGNSTTETDKETINTTGIKTSVKLPVTLYLAYRFGKGAFPKHKNHQE